MAMQGTHPGTVQLADPPTELPRALLNFVKRSLP